VSYSIDVNVLLYGSSNDRDFVKFPFLRVVNPLE